jgi:hypothetical protein
MLRIETRTETPTEVTYLLAGRATEEHLRELSRLLAGERERGRRVTLDLAGVVLADRAFVCFLASGRGHGAELLHCPAYVLSWIRCEGRCEEKEEEREPS